VNKERLLNVAKALRESPDASGFTMERYINHCGTPACALGHYAARTDLQNFLRQEGRTIVYADTVIDRAIAQYGDQETLDHFDISRTEAYALFSEFGCGGAVTAIEAAKYIERFVAEH
jgi:hypothetical protein